MIAVLAFLLVGCARVSEEATFLKEGVSDNTTEEPIEEVIDEPEQIPESESEPESVEESEDNAEESVEEDVEEESFEAKTSGSLNIQSDLDLCPHLKRKFDCDKYALKLCDLDNLGFAQFLPQQIKCRTSSVSGNEVCLLKECRPITDKGGIVKGYGGVFARGEYSFVKTSVDSQVWHDYSLERCGEMKKEFETEQDCIVWFE